MPRRIVRALTSSSPVRRIARTDQLLLPENLAVDGQVVVADTSEENGIRWGEVVRPSVVDAKGDLVIGIGDNRVSRLPAGPAGYVLMSDPSVERGLRWAEGGGGTPEGLGTAAYADTGTGDDEVVLGNDERLSDARTPLAHTHAAADITGLGTMATATATDYLSKAGNLDGIADAAVARTNLGLGSMATQAASAYAALTGATFTGDITFGADAGIRLGYGGRLYDPDGTRTLLHANGNQLDALNEVGSIYLFQANASGFTANNGLLALSNASGGKPVVVRGHAAQTANLFEGQNSGGSVLASISAAGAISATGLAVSNTGANVTYTISSGFSTLAKFNRGAVGNYNSTILQTGGTNVWSYGLQNGSTDFYIGHGSVAYDNSTIPAFSITNTGASTLRTATAANVALTVNNAHGTPSANLQNWQANSATVASISAVGAGTFSGLVLGSGGFRAPTSAGNLANLALAYNGAGVWCSNDPNASSFRVPYTGALIRTTFETNIGVTIRNEHAAPTGKLQSWQITTSNTEVASISAAGLGTFAGLTSVGKAAIRSAGNESGAGGASLLLGADDAGTTLTNASNKHMRFGMPHYTNAEEPVCIAMGQSTVSSTPVWIGGGPSNMNAATSIGFFTASGVTTTGGTRRGEFDSAGNFGIGGSVSAGGGVGITFIANATTPPSSNPTGGGILYVEAGALKYRGSSGTITTLAEA